MLVLAFVGNHQPLDAMISGLIGATLFLMHDFSTKTSYRADESLSTGIQGTGLGLSIAQQIVVHHQGSISHQNRIGGGSVFTVSFPINPEK